MDIICFYDTRITDFSFLFSYLYNIQRYKKEEKSLLTKQNSFTLKEKETLQGNE